MKIIVKSFWPAVVWLIISTVAFCIPGSALPKNDWFGQIHFDKFIHIGIFTVMVFLWCVPFLNRPLQKPFVKILAGVTIGFFCYGVLIEFVQHYFVLNRSFDLGDIGADAVGCLIGFFFSRRQWKLSEL